MEYFVCNMDREKQTGNAEYTNEGQTMKIKYTTCDGKTETEEIITEVVFYGHGDLFTGETIQGIQCTRPDGSEFCVDCEKIFYIKD